MKKYILIVLLSVISYNIHAQLYLKDLVDTVYNKYNNNGQKHGLWFEYSDSMITKKSYYKHERLNGEGIYYYNGNMLSKAFYKNDTLHGKTFSYYENGQVGSISNMEYGILNGIALGFYPNGDTSHIINYKNNKLHEWGIYYFKGNKISSKILYKNGEVVEKILHKENGEVLTNYIETVFEISSTSSDTIIITHSLFDKIISIRDDNGGFKELCYDGNKLRVIRYYYNNKEYKREVFDKKSTFIKKVFYYEKGILFKMEMYNSKGKIKKIRFY